MPRFDEVRIGEQTAPTDFGYTGQRLDASTDGLMYYGARYYLPELRRFISADTVVPGAGNPQNLNRYSYGRNNPVKYTDPTGHVVCADDECGVFWNPVNPGGAAPGLGTGHSLQRESKSASASESIERASGTSNSDAGSVVDERPSGVTSDDGGILNGTNLPMQLPQFGDFPNPVLTSGQANTSFPPEANRPEYVYFKTPVPHTSGLVYLQISIDGYYDAYLTLMVDASIGTQKIGPGLGFAEHPDALSREEMDTMMSGFAGQVDISLGGVGFTVAGSTNPSVIPRTEIGIPALPGGGGGVQGSIFLFALDPANSIASERREEMIDELLAGVVGQ